MSNKEDILIVKAKPGQTIMIQIEHEEPKHIGKNDGSYPLLTLTEIMMLVSEASGVSADDIKGKRRFPTITIARFIFCWIARAHYEYEFSTIGKFIDRDHTTIINAHKVVETTRGYRPPMDGLIKKLQEKFPFIL